MDVSASALSTGVASIQAGQQRAERAASELAGASQTPADSLAAMAEQLVELNLARLEVEAGARVVDTADEVLGTLVDTHA